MRNVKFMACNNLIKSHGMTLTVRKKVTNALDIRHCQVNFLNFFNFLFLRTTERGSKKRRGGRGKCTSFSDKAAGVIKDGVGGNRTMK